MDYRRITNPQSAYNYCENLCNSIHEVVLKKVAFEILRENKDKFLNIKGSDWHHHNYPGGLIVHTCNVAQNAIALAGFYSDKVCMDYIIFCSLMHDVGKLFDYFEQSRYDNDSKITMNQALLGHGFEGASYVAYKLREAYNAPSISVSQDYAKNVITQISHCIGAHMDDFGACSKQQMFEVIIIGCADKVDAYLEQTILNEDEISLTIATGEVFYKPVASIMLNNILQEDGNHSGSTH